MARRAIKRALQDSGIDLVPTKVPKTKTTKASRAAARIALANAVAASSSASAAAGNNTDSAIGSKTQPRQNTVNSAGSGAQLLSLSDSGATLPLDLNVPLEADFDMDAFEAQLERFDALPPPCGAMPKMPASIACLFTNMVANNTAGLSLPSPTDSTASGCSDSSLLGGDCSDSRSKAVPELSDSASDSKDDSSADEDFDEFFDFDSLCGPVTEDQRQAQAKLQTFTNVAAQKRGVPLMLYRDHHTERRVPDIPFNTRVFQRSWSALVEDLDMQTQNTYYQSLYLAAASLKPSSIASGRARQTIAPEIAISSSA